MVSTLGTSLPGRASRTAASWSVVALLGAAAAMRPACVEPAGNVGFDPGPMLGGLYPDVIEPALARAGADAQLLEQATSEWRSVREAGGDGEQELLVAQQAWTSFAGSWQEVELLQFGPGGPSSSAVGGQDLRDEVYSWPTVNGCRVDQELVEAGYDSADFFEVNLVNVYGLDTLEYLLFHPVGNDCAGQHPINDEGTWDGLGLETRTDRRAAYSDVLATGLRADVGVLADAWSPDGGDFASQLANAGGEGSVYPTQLSAINAVFDALFYLELETKDAKLGVPLGIHEDCGAPPCFDLVESPWSKTSAAHIASNLRGFRALYLGGEGLGLDDLLISLDESALNDELLAALDGADAQAAGLAGGLEDLLTEDIGQVEALHLAVKAVADLLKNDLAMVLVLQIPAEAGGDND